MCGEGGFYFMKFVSVTNASFSGNSSQILQQMTGTHCKGNTAVDGRLELRGDLFALLVLIYRR